MQMKKLLALSFLVVLIGVILIILNSFATPTGTVKPLGDIAGAPHESDGITDNYTNAASDFA